MAKNKINKRNSRSIKYKYDSAWIKQIESLNHWKFYWYQQKIMEGLVKPEKSEEILEVGLGSGFTSNYCKSKGFKVTTLDIDANKNPDIVANAASYDFPIKYDHLIAFEVFEHMPYEEFKNILFKLPSVIKHYVFISLPINDVVFLNFNLKLPKLKPFKFEWRVLRRKLSAESHHWELDYKEYSINKVEKLFMSAGFKIKRKLRYENIKLYALEYEDK